MRKSAAIRFLEKITGGPLTLGRAIRSIRLCEEQSLVEFSKLLGISPSHLSGVEKGRRAVGPEQAVCFAKILGYSEIHFVKLALQDLVDRGGLKLHVEVKAA